MPSIDALDVESAVLVVLTWNVPTGLSGDGFGEHQGYRSGDIGRVLRTERRDVSNAKVAGVLRSLCHYGLATRDGSKDPRYWPSPAALKAVELLIGVDT